VDDLVQSGGWGGVGWVMAGALWVGLRARAGSPAWGVEWMAGMGACDCG